MRIIYMSMGNTVILDFLLSKGINITGIARPQRDQETLISYFKDRLYDPLKRIARDSQIDYIKFSRKELDSLKEWLASKKPDLVLVHSMPFLIPEDVLSQASLGFVNLHPSYLPEYRGPNPWFWQLVDNPREIGYSIHFIDKGEDTGDIIFRDRIKLSGESFKEIKKRIELLGAKKMVELVNKFGKENEVETISQDPVSPTRRAKRVENGWEKIEFNKWNVERVYQFTKAAKPWLEPLKDYEVDDYVFTKHYKEAGEIIHEGSNVFLMAKDGVIYLKEQSSLPKILSKLKRCLSFD